MDDAATVELIDRDGSLEGNELYGWFTQATAILFTEVCKWDHFDVWGYEVEHSFLVEQVL